MSQYSNHNDEAFVPRSRMDGLDADIDTVRVAAPPVEGVGDEPSTKATYIITNGSMYVVDTNDAAHQLDQYQAACMRTAVFDERWGVLYPAIGLANEAGEALGKVKKWMRDDSPAGPDDLPGFERIRDIAYELGDTMWYLAVLANFLGLKLSDVARMNLEKLADRHARGKLHGSGDHR